MFATASTLSAGHGVPLDFQRWAMVDLAQVRQGLEGRTFKDFLLHHLKGQTEPYRRNAISGLEEMFGPALTTDESQRLRHWVSRGAGGELDHTDCGQVMDSFLADIPSTVGPLGSDQGRFDLFNLFVLRSTSGSTQRLHSATGNKTAEGMLSLVGLGMLIFGGVRVFGGDLFLGLGLIFGAFVVWTLSYRLGGTPPVGK
jgi:hypothetical protein